MSIQAVGWVLDHSESRGFARLAMISVANHADGRGAGSCASSTTIAEEAGMSRRQAIRILQGLVESGELALQGVSGRYGTKVYRLCGMASPQVSTSEQVSLGQGEVGDTTGDSVGDTAVSPEPLATEPKVNATHSPAVPMSLRVEVKNALAEAWQGTRELTPDAWNRVEKAASHILTYGVGKASGVSTRDIPAGIARFRELWDVMYPASPCTPQSVARDWAAFCSGAMGDRAQVAQAHADWIARVKRRTA